jgi:isoleucyl-tRNA synthetase
MMAPIAPFVSDRVYTHLMEATRVEGHGSVHLAPMIEPRPELRDEELERRMQLAQTVASLVRAMRTRSNLRVRQPLARIAIPAGPEVRDIIETVRDIVLEEINVKQIEFVDENSPLVRKTATPNFRKLGPRFGNQVNAVAERIRRMTQPEILEFETLDRFETEVGGVAIALEEGDLSLSARDIEGWIVEADGTLTVALDTTLTPELVTEGIAREFVNRVQNMRKDVGLDVTDRIRLGFSAHERVSGAIRSMTDYVQSETLASSLESHVNDTDHLTRVEIDGETCEIGISKAL